MTWTYGRSRFHRSTIDQLLTDVHDHLRSIEAHCRVHGGYTPSDFPQAALTQEALDRLLGTLTPELEA